MSDDVGFVCPHCTTKIKYTAGMTFGEVMSLRHDKEHLSHKITCLRAENSKSKSLISELLDYAESLEGRLDSHDLGMLEDTDLKSRARAALEGVTVPAKGESNA